ncbi:FG-GAP-like repeat-containing protein [Flavicella sediminum]|uniref:FG-GAP-like repeat-containing protein n=1 Tax=Flavicella sediminum TaxID=2585141 RepID=UPI00111CE65D|nr:FG-GAP-like repeat-containing protein [Flavicella sediminum]
MKKIISIFILIAFFSISQQSTAQSCNDVPVINSFEPNTGFIGSVVTIFGANFDSNIITNNIVYFGSTKAQVLSATFGTLKVVVPVGASTAPISVTNQCDLTAYSKVAFNGIFCPTPLNNQTYNNRAFDLTGVYGAYNMISQDLDLDGKPEVISSSNGGGLTIAVNNSTPGNLSFTKINRSGGGQSIYAADFDGDGLKDLLSTYYVNRNTSTGPGNISFAAPQSIPQVSRYQIAAGDFNNDGKIDIIGSNGNNIYIAFNTSTGPGNIAFGSAQYIANPGHCTGIQVADIDGDGKTDFIASQGPYNRAVSIRNTTATGSMTQSFDAPEFWASGGSYPYRAGLADFDKDGKIDFTSCNYSGATNTAIWRNISTVGNIVFASTVNLAAPGANYRIGVGDVDGDGYPDIVTKSLGANVFSVYKNTSSAPGTPTFAARIDYNSSWQAEVSGIVIGDLDGDFVPDIATSGISSNRILFHRNISAQVDTDAPTAICKNITVALSPQGTVSITADMIDDGSSDACGLDKIEISNANFTCADIGENEVVLTVTDNGGNTATCTAIVNVQPAAIIVSGQTTVCQGGIIPMEANLGDSYLWKKDGVVIAGATNRTYDATVSGSYTVNVTNSGGCSGESLATVVTVNNNPTVNVSPSGTTYICPPDGNAELTASQSSIYQWMLNGVDIPNATQQIYTTNTVGNYSVRVIDLFGCSAISDEITVASNPPEIDVVGSGDYGNILPNQNYTQTFLISNTGTNSLDINSISITGVDAGYFSFNISSNSIAPGSSANLDVVFNAPNITTYLADLTIESNDCDESLLSYPLSAEITCLAADIPEELQNIEATTDIGVCTSVVTYDVATVGNPAAEISYIFTGATTGNGSGIGSGSLFNLGTTTVTVNASNACGDVSKSFNILVTDNTAPNIIANDLAVELDANGNATISAEDIENGSTDACGIASISVDKSNFDCSNIGNNDVILTVTDNNNNSSTTTVNVVVSDTIVPTVITQNIIVALSNGEATITPESIDGGSFDNCEIASMEISRNFFECGDDGDHKVTLTVTDVNGNSSSNVAIVTIKGVIPTVTIDDFTAVNGQNQNTVFIGYGPSEIELVTNANGGSGFTYSWTANSGESIDNVANPTIKPTANTIYTVVVTNSNGCSATTSIEVCVIDARSYDKKGNIQKGKVTICHHTSSSKNKFVMINVSTNAVAKHIENHGDTLGDCEATCITVTPTITSSPNSFKTTENNTAASPEVIVYPNPAKNNVSISLNTGENVPGTIQIYEFSGKMIYSKVIQDVNKGQNVSIKNLKKGTYLAKVIYDGNVFVESFVKN